MRSQTQIDSRAVSIHRHKLPHTQGLFGDRGPQPASRSTRDLDLQHPAIVRPAVNVTTPRKAADTLPTMLAARTVQQTFMTNRDQKIVSFVVCNQHRRRPGARSAQGGVLTTHTTHVYAQARVQPDQEAVRARFPILRDSSPCGSCSLYCCCVCLVSIRWVNGLSRLVGVASGGSSLGDVIAWSGTRIP